MIDNTIRLPYIEAWTTDYSSGAWGSGTLSLYAPYITLDGRIVWKNADRVSLPDSKYYKIETPERYRVSMHYYPIAEGILSQEQIDYLQSRLAEAKESRRIERNAARRKARAEKPLNDYYAAWLRAFVDNGGWNGYNTKRVCWQQYGLPGFEKGIPAEQSGHYAALRYKAHSLRDDIAELSEPPAYEDLPALIAVCESYEHQAEAVKSAFSSAHGR